MNYMFYGPGEVKRIIDHKAPADRRKKTKDFQYCIIDIQNQSKWVDACQLQNHRALIDRYHQGNPQVPNPFGKKSTVSGYNYEERDMTQPTRGRGRGRPPGRPPKNPYDDRPPRKQNMVYEMLPISMNETMFKASQFKAQKYHDCSIAVEGIYSDLNNQIYYRVRDEMGAQTIKSRKWVLGKDKRALIYFYESLIREVTPSTMN